MQIKSFFLARKITPEQLFMLSVLVVNGGNYLYNLILGRLLGPTQFADAAVLVTFLLVLSFVAMTFQLVTAKFSVLYESNLFRTFIQNFLCFMNQTCLELLLPGFIKMLL